MFNFLKMSLSETDGTPSSKRLVYFIVIMFGIALCAFIIIKFGVIQELVSIFNSLMYSSSAVSGVGRAMENSSALNNFGNTGVPSPKISDVMMKKLSFSPPPPEGSAGAIKKAEGDKEDSDDLGITPKDS